MRAKLYLSLCLLVFGHIGWAQKPISGKVTDGEAGEPIPGVNVKIKNTGQGAVTNLEGGFRLMATPEDTLVFSFVGYLTENMVVGNQTDFQVTLMPDLKALEEVVVVGYGVQKKSVVTGSISSVRASDLETMPITRVDQALQGRTSGLTIASSSGQPGSDATIRVRGVTSIRNGANNPLWVVDGVVVDNISFLNASDIASMEVLKDAASQAIYGSRAAAGVILVTTKKGKSGSLRVNYNGFYGTSAPARKLDLLNATEYATLRNEASLQSGGGIIYEDPASLGEGTDWQDAIFSNDSRRQNHELSLSGGNDVSTFYTSVGYLAQEGIVMPEISNYERFNFRLNSTHKLAPWLTVGENLGFAHEKTVGIGNTNNEFGGPLNSAINLDPLTPLVETDPAKVNSGLYTNLGVRRDAYGNPYGLSGLVGQEISNPLAYASTRLGNYDWANNVVGNVFLEAEPLKGLVFRSTLGTKLAYWGGEYFTPVYWLNSSSTRIETRFERSMRRRFDWNIENTLSYTRSFEEHNFTLLLGQGAYKERVVRGINFAVTGIPVEAFEDASLNYKRPGTSEDADGFEDPAHTLNSLFVRLNYNFKEKYLFTGVMRRDGSSRFGGDNKFGYFPSASVGWVTSAEEFWPENNVVNFLKIRGSYGVVGNDNFDDFAYLSTISPGRNYTFGTSGDYLIGYSPDAPANPALKWEETTQSNIGFEATLFHNLTVTFDAFRKVTTDMLMQPRIPAYTGAIGNPWANVAEMENYGLELELGYGRKIGELGISLNGNVSWLKNEITYLGEELKYTTAGQQTHQSIGYPITRNALGHPVNAFYGFQRLGIFQTAEDVLNHTTEVEGAPVVIQPGAVPGDIIWADLNEDGKINEDDRTFIGNPTPAWTFGFTTNFDYKGFDLTIFGQGVSGNQIFQGLRRFDAGFTNYQEKALGRWTGPGTSNDYPRLGTNANGNFTNPSDFYLEDGGYFRIKTVQLGYSLPVSLIENAGLTKARVYVMSENLFTLTNYTGFDPEIGGDVLSIDRGIYPQARSFMLGVSLGF